MTARVTPIRKPDSAPDESTTVERAPTSTTISGWGRYPTVQARTVVGEDFAEVTSGAALSRGLGRSYGDAALPGRPDDVIAGSELADRLISFDPTSGLLRGEAGCPLYRINRIFLPRGWFTPVTPGTHFVTLGGMVAADVHGKMHHSNGSFGEHVTALTMRVADGRVIECSDTVERDLFRATLGGMGLTGHILEVEFRLERIPSPWIFQETERVPTFDLLLDRLAEAGKTWPFTVCWADFLTRGRGAGRGVLMKGRWAEPGEAPPRLPKFRSPITVPPVFPSWFLQPWMVRTFWWLNYTWHGDRLHRGIAHPETFFYPLDIARDWNRLYGPRGFTQYQCVLPHAPDHGPHRRFLQRLQQLDAQVFLCVPKDCGAEGRGMLSFPRPGFSFALDIPVDSRTQAIVDQLNECVIAEGGRIYLAKDAFTRAEHFRALEPRLEAWQAVRRRWDPAGRFRSAQSVRLFGDPG